MRCCFGAGRETWQLSAVAPPVDGKRAFDMVMVLIVRTCERLMELISSGRLQAQLLLIVVVVFASALVPLLGQTIMHGKSSADARSMRSSRSVARRCSMRDWCGDPGEVSPARGADHGRRRWLDDLPDIRLVLGAGSGLDADRESRSSRRCCCCLDCDGCRGGSSSTRRIASHSRRALAARGTLQLPLPSAPEWLLWPWRS